MVRTWAIPLVPGLLALSLVACDATQSPLAPSGKPTKASVYSPSGLGAGGTVRNYGGYTESCTPPEDPYNQPGGYTCTYGHYDNISAWTASGMGARVRVTTTYCGKQWVSEASPEEGSSGATAQVSGQASVCGGPASSFHEIWYPDGSYESFSSFE
ncbi:MAG TPA: hypothetical protein VGR37_05760 [Longimicrobiaceae bacterium]|nr:hypothetical protein [Longimicrobiaceae bacterium]